MTNCRCAGELVARPKGCACHWEFGDSPCDAHPACDECGVLVRAIDDDTGMLDMYRGSCDCGLELHCGVRGTIVRTHLLMVGQLALTDSALLSREESYTFVRLDGAHT